MISAIAQAAAALATFAAVLVALHPIFAARKRSKAAAINLRARILSNLMILRPALDDLSKPSKHPKTIFTDAEKTATNSLENMLQEAIILKAAEHDALTALIANLLALKAIMQNNYSHQVPNSAKNILKQVDDFFAQLEKSEWLQGKMPDLPWTKHDKTEN
jgi:prephenate dehydrogenase